jgi:hypothetical protein
MPLLKKNDPRRKWRAFKRNALLLAKAFCLASVATYVWLAAWINGIHFAEDDKDVVVGAIIVSIGVIYAVITTWLITAVWEKYCRLVVAVLEKNMHNFLLYRDERMPIMVHLSTAVVAVPLFCIIGMIDYRDVLTGMVSVFVLAFILIFVWIMIAKLENPLKEGWFAERIDKSWLTIDVDDYFGLNKPGGRVTLN